MGKYNISVLERVIKEIYIAKTLDDGKALMNQCIKDSKIKDEDKKKMFLEVDKIQTLVKLHFYVTNAMFKFEGLGVTDFKNIQ